MIGSPHYADKTAIAVLAFNEEVFGSFHPLLVLTSAALSGPGGCRGFASL